MTQTDKILKVLTTHGMNTPGIATAKLAAKAKVPTDTVRKRIFDLKNDGFAIYTNTRKVKGRNQNFYRYAG